MTQATRPCAVCETPVSRTAPLGPIPLTCSVECRRLHKSRTRASRVFITESPCHGCGALVKRTGSRGRIPKYCSHDCRPRCVIPDCKDPLTQTAHGWCEFHYDRWRKTGDPLTPVTRNMTRGLACQADGCDEERRKRDWCTDHYNAWRRHGDPNAPRRRWSERLDECRLCGAPTIRELRQYCSKACWVTAARARAKGKSEIPTTVRCSQCACLIDVSRRAGRQTRRTDTMVCRDCVYPLRKHGVSPRALAREDGPGCGICGDDVDLTLRRPDPMRASVDHKIPVARGGTSERANLQLAHLRCNMRKGARLMA